VVAAADPDDPGSGQPDDTSGAALDRIGQRIEAMRDARRPPPRRENEYVAASQAWRMVLELVIGMMVGLGMGWGLDWLFGTLPLFLMVFGMLGFAAGVRTMMRTAEEVRRQSAEPSAGSRKADGRPPAHRE